MGIWVNSRYDLRKPLNSTFMSLCWLGVFDMIFQNQVFACRVVIGLEVEGLDGCQSRQGTCGEDQEAAS
jgi:hypothetical protein